jgi:hypothetical protein
MADEIELSCPECGARLAKNQPNCWLCNHEFVTAGTRHVPASSGGNKKPDLLTASILALTLLPAVFYALFIGCSAGFAIEESGWVPLGFPLGRVTVFMAITSAVVVGALFVVGILQALTPGSIWKEKSRR